MRRLFPRLVVLLAMFALGVPAAGASSHLDPDNRPTPLEGTENGRVPPERLVTAAPGCRVAREAGPSLALLLRQAGARNVGLHSSWCYRSIEDQLRLYEHNTSTGGPCTAQPSYYPDGRPRGTSNHGWGKAVDFRDARGSLTFSSAGYHFLKAHAQRTGWHHPRWAWPGMRCAEPWHWEWIGDGGTNGGPVVRADVVAIVAAPDGGGYASVTGFGAVHPRGSFTGAGSADGVPINWVIVDARRAPAGGYWLVGGDGGVFTFGDADFHGSTGNLRLNAPIVGIAPTPTGDGYWLVGADGGVFTFGDADFHGSTGNLRLNAPVTGAAGTSTGGGYWLLAEDGGIFTFGDAPFHGSAADRGVDSPFVDMSAPAGAGGYWLIAADGTVADFGAAAYFGDG